MGQTQSEQMGLEKNGAGTLAWCKVATNLHLKKMQYFQSAKKKFVFAGRLWGDPVQFKKHGL